MNSNERPVTITAAEFVANGYAAKIARGECVVSFFGQPIRNLTPCISEDRHVIWFANFNHVTALANLDDVFTVEWLPPTDRDEAAHAEMTAGQEAEIARLQAEVARLREALEKIAAPIPQRVIEFWHTRNMKPEDAIAGCLSIARRALGETTATTNSEPDHR